MMGGTNRKILIIEDDRDFSEVLRMRLESLDFDVVLLSDGTDAVKVAKEEDPVLILLDIFLPEMDGFTALKSLKAEKGLTSSSSRPVCGIPVMVMTGKAPMMEDTVLFEGACEFLTKPIDVDKLVRRVEQILKK